MIKVDKKKINTHRKKATNTKVTGWVIRRTADEYRVRRRSRHKNTGRSEERKTRENYV